MPVYPTGIDWGDGITQLPNQPLGSSGTGTFGTPTPPDALLQSNAGGGAQNPEEAPDSPEIERAEQGTVKHVLNMAYSDGIQLLLGLGRGTYQQDSAGNITRVLSSNIKKMPGNQCQITIISESISFDTPPDEFRIVPIDLGLDIIKNPRYSWAIAPVSTDSSTTVTVGDTQIDLVVVKSSLIRLIQAYRDSPFFPSADQVNGLIQNNIMGQLNSGNLDVQVPIAGYDPGTALSDPPRWDGVIDDLPDGNYAYAIVSVPVNLSDPSDPIAIAVAATKEILSKLWRQEDTPYLTGYQITWTQFFFAPAYLDPGGYIQDPLTVVPDYFMQPQTLQSVLARGDFGSAFGNLDTVAPNSGQPTIFDHLAQINPQSYSSDGTTGGAVNISWLRKADEVEYQRTWFAVTHSWVGSPIGNWDFDLYTQGDRPQNANDFDQLIA